MLGKIERDNEFFERTMRTGCADANKCGIDDCDALRNDETVAPHKAKRPFLDTLTATNQTTWPRKSSETLR
jgi:hypothetical protein